MHSNEDVTTKKRAFVTGATGLLGSNLVRALVDAGWEVRALARSERKARQQLRGLPVDVVIGDLGDVEGFAAKLDGAQVLFHTAAHFRDSYKGGRHREALHDVNVRGTRALVEAAYARGVRKIVHTSSVAVVRAVSPGRAIDETMARPADGEKDDYYRSKILADAAVEEILRERPDLWACFVLPGFMNGPGDAGPTSAGQLVLDHLHGRLPGVLDATFSYVDARDVADAMIRAVDRGRRGEKYLVAGRAMHLRDALAELAAASGIAAPTRRVPMPMLAVIALLNEAWARLSGRPVLVSWAGYRTLLRERDAMTFDSSKAARELGVTFRPLRDTFADAVAWFEREGLAPVRRALPAAAADRA